MKTHKLEAFAGSTFDTVAAEAKKYATENKVTVEFDFNGVKCLVNSKTNLKWLYRDYANSWTMEWKTVGAVCVAKYSSEVQKELKKRTEAREAKNEKERLEREVKENKEKEEFIKQTRGVEIELSDKAGWDKTKAVNSDGYGGGVMEFAEGWAKLMQIEIANGKTVKDCAEKLSFKFSWIGLSGAQYGFAVGILSKCWKHGEELRKWHNKSYGVSEDKTGVVNPAMLTIG